MGARPTQGRLAAILAAAGVAAGAASGCMGGDEQEPRPDAAGVEGRPNIVLIVTDDQEATSLEQMPKTLASVADEGATLNRFYTSYPLCCPSRTTVWSGQYAHNHGVSGNFPADDGGGYVNLIEPERVLPEWLRRSGYRTAHVGKWASVPGKVPPKGWNRWIGIAQEASARFYDYALFDSKLDESVPYGDADSDYHSDVMTRRAVRLMTGYSESKRPWFLSIAYLAPHVGFGRKGEPGTERCNPGGEPDAAVPATRHADAFADEPLPEPPSFDEDDIGDKTGTLPSPISSRKRRELELEYRCRLASLQSVDDGVDRIVRKLDELGELDNTYVIFTSDNGFLLGEHRIPARKNLPYEESIRVPFVVRGPGIDAGSTVGDLAMNTDLAPTILDWAGADQPEGLERPLDGVSLAPRLGGDADARGRAILVEGRYDTGDEAEGDGFPVESYTGIRTDRFVLIRKFRDTAPTFAEGAGVPIGAGELIGTELYDMQEDPFQLESVAESPRYSKVRAALEEGLDALSECEGDGCATPVAVPPPIRR